MRTLLLVLAGVLALPSIALAAPPANDDFANPVDLNAISDGFLESTNIEATKETNEPDHAGNAGGHSVWYSWTAPANGSISNLGIKVFGDFDTLLAVYTGSAVDMLTEVASNDDVSSGGSSLSFSTTPGQTYAIAVDGFAGKSGRFQLAWSEAPPNDNFAAATALSGASGSRRGDTRGATAEHGEPDPSGAGLTVWYSWTPPATGTYKFATAGSSFDTVLAIYAGSSLATLDFLRGNDDDPDRGCCSSWVPLVRAQPTTTYMIQVSALDGLGGALALQWGPLILGSNRSQRINGTPAAEEIRARGGNDVVLAGGGADLIFGGAGRDVLRGGGGSDLILDRLGMDALFGQGGSDRLDARDSRRGDRLAGGRGADVCRADRGDSRRSC
jgi:RTX calcium-binding nonapeptide repeat (4 copies)